MKIKQAYVSQGLIYIRSEFYKRWKLKEYHDPNAPALFVGCYTGQDLFMINKHRGFKLMLFGGADMPRVGSVQVDEIVIDEFSYNYRLSKLYKGRIKQFIRVPFKDYSQFQKVPHGSKIYCYVNNLKKGNNHKHRMDLVQRIMKRYGDDQVLLGIQGNTIETMISDYYSKSFINLQLNPMAGFTSALEMAHMGRVSVSNHEAPFCKKWRTIDDIFRIIDRVRETKEEAYVGDFLHMEDDWLDPEFWK